MEEEVEEYEIVPQTQEEIWFCVSEKTKLKLVRDFLKAVECGRINPFKEINTNKSEELCKSDRLSPTQP